MASQRFAEHQVSAPELMTHAQPTEKYDNGSPAAPPVYAHDVTGDQRKKRMRWLSLWVLIALLVVVGVVVGAVLGTRYKSHRGMTTVYNPFSRSH